MYLYVFEDQSIYVDDAGPTEMDFMSIEEGTLRVLEVVEGDVQEILSPTRKESLPRCTIGSMGSYDFHVEAVE